MSIRTTPIAVQEILLSNYVDSTDAAATLVRCIKGASFLVDDLITCASAKGKAFSDDRLEHLECLLAADAYVNGPDARYSSRSTQDASGNFLATQDDYYKMAERLDPSGCLREMREGKVTAEMYWGGKPPSTQINYPDRD